MELLVTYHLKKESAEEFLRKLGEIGIPGLVRGERGCIRYDYYVPAEENGTLLLLEEWESRIAGAPSGTVPHEAPGADKTGLRCAHRGHGHSAVTFRRERKVSNRK